MSWPSFCVLLTFFRLFDAMIIPPVISWFHFPASLVFDLMVLHISAYSISCLSLPFSNISLRFIMRARVDDDILAFSGLVITLATLDALCWIMSGIVSMSSSSCSF